MFIVADQNRHMPTLTIGSPKSNAHVPALAMPAGGWSFAPSENKKLVTESNARQCNSARPSTCFLPARSGVLATSDHGGAGKPDEI
jgi:hypothetical protein